MTLRVSDKQRIVRNLSTDCHARPVAEEAPVKLTRGRIFSIPPQGLKIHVYDLPYEFEGAILEKYEACHTYQWASEVLIPKKMRAFKTAVDPSNADFYLVPFPVKCFNNYVAKHNKDVVNEKYLSLLNWIRTNFTWFDRSGGMDHVFIFPSGQGQQIFPSSSTYLRHSIFLLAEGDRSQNYTSPFKDIIVPGFTTIRPADTTSTKRTTLAYFRGSTTMSVALFNGTKVTKKNELRLSLLDQMRNKDDVIFTNTQSRSYVEELRHSKFVICPRGITPWTRRVYDGIFSGAVPVIISDDAVFPFEADIDWSLFTIKAAEQDAIKPGFLYRMLQELVNNGTYQRKAEALQEFRINVDWTGDDVFNGILWELHRRRRRFKHGSLRVWDV